MEEKYRIVGISEPGLINVMVDGHCRDVKLFEADNKILDKLYKDGCPYVQLTPDGVLANNPGSPAIKVINIQNETIQPKIMIRKGKK